MISAIGGIDVGERAQRLVAEAVARRTGGEHGLDERRLQQRLVAAGDPDGDRLRLVLDGVDGTGELLDALGERGGEVVDHDGGRADPAVLGLVGVERCDAEGVAVRRRQPDGGAGLEVAVVGAVAQPVEEPGRRGGEGGAQRAQQPLAVGDRVLADGVLDGGPGLAHRPRLRVDGEGRLVAEQVPGHRGEHEGELRVRLRHGDHVQRGGEARLAVGGDRRSATPCGPGRSRPPWPRRRRSTPRARRRTRG